MHIYSHYLEIIGKKEKNSFFSRNSFQKGQRNLSVIFAFNLHNLNQMKQCPTYGRLFIFMVFSFNCYNKYSYVRSACFKTDGTMACIIFPKKLASGRNVVIMNTSHLNLRQQRQAEDAVYIAPLEQPHKVVYISKQKSNIPWSWSLNIF